MRERESERDREKKIEKIVHGRRRTTSFRSGRVHHATTSPPPSYSPSCHEQEQHLGTLELLKMGPHHSLSELLCTAPRRLSQNQTTLHTAGGAIHYATHGAFTATKSAAAPIKR